MVVRKNNVHSVNFSTKSIGCLQLLGYLTKGKRSTKQKSMSLFISSLVEDFVGINLPKDKRILEDDLLRIKLVGLQDKRDYIEEEIIMVSEQRKKLKAIKEVPK